MKLCKILLITINNNYKNNKELKSGHSQNNSKGFLVCLKVISVAELPCLVPASDSSVLRKNHPRDT